jgi:hypothetical protein
MGLSGVLCMHCRGSASVTFQMSVAVIHGKMICLCTFELACTPHTAYDALKNWDAQYVDFGSVQRTVRVQYAVRCLVRCLYAAVKGTCNVLVKVSLEVTY